MPEKIFIIEKIIEDIANDLEEAIKSGDLKIEDLAAQMNEDHIKTNEETVGLYAKSSEPNLEMIGKALNIKMYHQKGGPDLMLDLIRANNIEEIVVMTVSVYAGNYYVNESLPEDKKIDIHKPKIVEDYLEKKGVDLEKDNIKFVSGENSGQTASINTLDPTELITSHQFENTSELQV